MNDTTDDHDTRRFDELEEDDLPTLAAGLADMDRYDLREELFDKAWLSETTGHEYEAID